MTNFKIAINRQRFVEKPGQDMLWETFNSNFFNMEVDVLRLCNAIYLGHAYCPWMDGKRKVENFQLAQHIAIDMDCGDERATLDSLIQHPLVVAYGGIVHETPSHKPDAPRARVIFILDEPITNADGYKAAIQVVTDLFDGSDPACVDAARFFYGNGRLYMLTRPEAIWFNPDACLPLSELRRYAKMRNEQRRAQAVSPTPWRVAPPSNTFDPDHVTDTIIGKASAGERNRLGFWLACTLAEHGQNRIATEGYLRRYQQAVEWLGKDAYTLHEALSSVASAFRTVTA